MSTIMSNAKNEIAWAILPKCGAVLSITSSFFLARDVYIKHRQHMTKHDAIKIPLTSAMLFQISVNDIFGGFFSYFMSTWMMPIGTAPFAVGDQATCDAQGYFTTFHFIYFVTAYTELALLYWLIVKRGWSDDRWSIKALFGVPPILISFVLSLIPIFTEMYNPARIHCFVNTYPAGCAVDGDASDCVRGGHNTQLLQSLSFAYALACNLIIIVFMGLLVFVVYSQEKKGDKYLAKGQAKKRDNTIDTAWQGVRYTGAFTLAYLTVYIFMGLNLTQKERRLGFDILFYFHVILTPLMGFYNACVYYYPRWVKLQEQNKQNDAKLRILMKMLKINNSQCCCCLWRKKGGETPIGNANNDEELQESFL